MTPTKLLMTVFGKLPGQTMMEFKTEIDELKKLPDYKEFLEEVAVFANSEVIWPGTA